MSSTPKFKQFESNYLKIKPAWERISKDPLTLPHGTAIDDIISYGKTQQKPFKSRIPEKNKELLNTMEDLGFKKETKDVFYKQNGVLRVGEEENIVFNTTKPVNPQLNGNAGAI